MAQRSPRDGLRRPGLARAFAAAMASALAGCGGNSTSGEPLDARSDEAELDQQQAGNEPAPGVEPPGPAQPVDGAIAAPADPASEAERLPPQETMVELTSETVRVGAGGDVSSHPVFVARSPLGTQLELVEASERICVRGALAVVPNGDYPNYWGGEVGLVLGSSPATDVALPDEGLPTPGFSFRLAGELPPQLRLRVAATGEVPLTSQYCQAIPATTDASIEMPLRALTFECWLPDGASFPADASATLVSWQIPANEGAASGFDFCIEDIRALP
jgi:hypothetical protein